MGLFSSKKKTLVNTSVSRMVDDADIVSSSKIAVIDFTMRNKASIRLSDDTISDAIIKSGQNNIVARSRKARNYAKKSSFAYGLPESNLVSQDGVDVLGAVQDSLEKIYP